MINPLRIAATAAVLSLAACSQAPAEAPPLTGAWTIDSEASRLSYVSIKLGEVAESNSISGIAGSVSADGAVEIEIDLASVDTGIDIRNERMREFLFEVTDHPTATISAQVDPAAFASLRVGESLAQEVETTLSLKGIESTVYTNVTVTRIAENRVQVASADPVLVSANTFDLTAGIAKLQELASLESITPVVPVSFLVTFEQ